jgi:hypothetical protein
VEEIIQHGPRLCLSTVVLVNHPSWLQRTGHAGVVLGPGVDAEELIVEAICRYPEPLENALGGVVLREGGVVGEETGDVF